MSGILLALVGNSGGQPVSQFSGSLESSNFGPAASTCSVSFAPDGSVSGAYSPSGSEGATGDLWFSPISADVGDTPGYWIKATTTLNSAPSTGIMSPTLQKLDASRSWSYSSGTGGVSDVREGTVRFDIYSDVGGSSLVATGSYSFLAERES